MSHNTVSIPKGCQYKVVLSDGSKVWLNAASSIRFPAVFSGKERRVELTGEAYFEVAKDASKPFRIYVSEGASGAQRGALVEVLGTYFNINAYSDEQVLKTTLLEGSVKVSPLHASTPTIHTSRILIPGQQAQITARSLHSGGIQVQNVDINEVMAWKNNMFNFNRADIQTIMRQIARWYDVEVVYKGAAPVRNFSGKINHSTDLSTVLKILEQSGIRFQLEGKKIIVGS
jgi:ferric-dicitrate binding protein FerR (iron transport regulator)